ncbi:hypothetical protein D3C71_1979200 [compost metagenome]
MHCCQLGEVNLSVIRNGDPLLLCLTEDAADTRMRILNVEYRVLIRSRDRQVHIEIEMGIHATHGEEITNRIDSYFLHQIFHRNRFAGTLGHFNLFTILEQTDHLSN